VEFPQPPLQVKALTNNVRGELNEADLVTGGMGSGYDELTAGNVIVPLVYGNGEPCDFMWWNAVGGSEDHFPLARDCAEEAWEGIVVAEDPQQGVPDRLLDAWDNEKRSREYRNSEMDKFDLDNIYYGQAYKTDDD